jgi:glutamine synthetase
MKDKEYVLKAVKERNVRFIRLWFTDILGMLKSVAITPSDLERSLEEGVSFDGSSVEGFVRSDESDMVMMPDPNTFQILPWRSKTDGAVARLFCDILNPDGTPYENDPRWVLKKAIKRASDKGYVFYVGPEIEFFYLRSSKGTPEGLDEGGYFDLTPLDVASDLRRDTVTLLEEMGIEVVYSHHEVAPSQHEIDLRYTDALTMADNVMTYRLVVKEVAMKHGFYATFMPKPFSNQNGSGMHVNLSLFKGSRNAFFDANDKQHISKTAKLFVAGLLKHAPEITIVTNQWINSYKRLVPGFEAPVYVSWSYRNHGDLIRIPICKPHHEESARIEYRAPDPACNPYLAFAVLLAAGLNGIEKKYELPDPADRDVHTMTDEERMKAGITSLPDSIHEAILLAEKSDLLRETLGSHLLQSLLANKKAEWNRFKSCVTEFELANYLPVL